MTEVPHETISQSLNQRHAATRLPADNAINRTHAASCSGLRFAAMLSGIIGIHFLCVKYLWGTAPLMLPNCSIG